MMNSVMASPSRRYVAMLRRPRIVGFSFHAFELPEFDPRGRELAGQDPSEEIHDDDRQYPLENSIEMAKWWLAYRQTKIDINSLHEIFPYEDLEASVNTLGSTHTWLTKDSEAKSTLNRLTFFSGPAAHQVYMSSRSIEEVRRTMEFHELWVKMHRDILVPGDLIVMRDTHSPNSVLNVFTIKEVCIPDTGGFIKLGEVL